MDSEPHVRHPWQNSNVQSSIIMRSLAPLFLSLSANGPLPPFKATASSFTLIVQPLIRISVQASMSIASVLGALTGAEGLVMRQLR